MSEEDQLLQSSPSAYAVAPRQQRGNKDTDVVHAQGRQELPGECQADRICRQRQLGEQLRKPISATPTIPQPKSATKTGAGRHYDPIAPGSGGAITPCPRLALSRVSDQMTSSAINNRLPGGAISARSLLAA